MLEKRGGEELHSEIESLIKFLNVAIKVSYEKKRLRTKDN